MPLYEVFCPKCGREKEYIGKSSEEVLAVRCCTNCGANYELKISASNFSLKGDGWARQGYAKP